jgi:hypothetical protein
VDNGHLVLMRRDGLLRSSCNVAGRVSMLKLPICSNRYDWSRTSAHCGPKNKRVMIKFSRDLYSISRLRLFKNIFQFPIVG